MCKTRGRLEQQCCQTNTHERKSSCVWSGHVSLTQIQHKGKDTHGSWESSRPGLFTHKKGKKRRSREAKENGDKFADAENDDKEEEEEEIEEEEKTTQSNDRQ